MRVILFYLFLCLSLSVFAALAPTIMNLPDWFDGIQLYVKSGNCGFLAGLLYCLRSIYIQKSVKKEWSKEWLIWYYLRPPSSAITGLISTIFLQAGLLILDADQGNNEYGYLALAFIAGYNVDKFLLKLEDIAKSIWGIEKSNSSKKN